MLNIHNKKARQANGQGLSDPPDILRVAAQAVLISIGKYYALTDDCEVYHIAISELDHTSCSSRW